MRLQYSLSNFHKLLFVPTIAEYKSSSATKMVEAWMTV